MGKRPNESPHRNPAALILLAVVLFMTSINPSTLHAQETKPNTAGQPGHEPRTYTLAYGGQECEICYELAKAIYGEAFSRLGHRDRIISLPSERSLIETNAGNFDGEVSRVPGFDFENRYPNLMQVPERLRAG